MAQDTTGLWAAFDGDAMLAPVRAPGGGVDGEEKEEEEEEEEEEGEGPEWGARGWQAVEKAWWARIALEAERQWAAVNAAAQAQWAAVQPAIRAFYEREAIARIVRLDWDAVGAGYIGVWGELAEMGAKLWSPISTIARLEGALLGLDAQERWAQAQATIPAAGGVQAEAALRAALVEQRAARQRAVEAVWTELRAAAVKWRVTVFYNLILTIGAINGVAEQGIQKYHQEWPALGAAAPPPAEQEG